MIKINLLPVDKRKAERTPLPRFGLILANVGVAAALVCIVVIELIYIGVRTGKRNDLRAERDGLAAVVAEYDKTLIENQRLKAKLAEVESISGSSVDWWRVVDALWDVIHENPRVWLDDIQMLDAQGAKSAATSYDPASAASPPFGLTFGCHAAGLDVSVLTKFRNDLRLNPLLKAYFREINFNPEWTTQEHEEFAEKFSLAFKVSMIGSEKPAAPPPAAVPPAGGAKP